MKEHPVLRRRNFFQGRRIRGSKVCDIMWLVPRDREMTDPDGVLTTSSAWACGSQEAASGREARRATRARRDPLYMLNADEKAVHFTLPTFEPGLTWRCLIDRFDERRETQTFTGGETFQLADRAAALFQGVPD
jgi:glycogen operon protein